MKAKLFIVFCFFLSSFFIFHHIGQRAFWGDEADVANMLNYSYVSLFQKAVINGHPIIYVYFLKSWSFFFGNSEIALRGFSAFFALILVFFIYKASKNIFESRRIAVITTVLASSNYFLIWFATQNKVYTFSAFLSLVSYYFFIKIALKERKLKNYFFYCFFTIVFVYTHPWAILVFGSQIISVFLKEINNAKKILLFQVVIFLLSVPSLLISFHQGRIGASAWIGKVDFFAVLESFKYLSFGSSFIYFVFFFVALFYIFEKGDRIKDSFSSKEFIIFKIILIYLFFPLFSAFIISQIKPIYVLGRYEMVVLPAFLLAASLWFSKIRNSYVLSLMAFLAIAFCAKAVLADSKTASNYKIDDRTISRELLERMKGGGVIIATDLSYSTFYYYLNRYNNRKEFYLITFPEETIEHPGWKNFNPAGYDREAEDLAKSLSGKEVWVLYNSRDPLNNILREKLNKYFNKEEIEKLSSERAPSWIDSILKFNNL